MEVTKVLRNLSIMTVRIQIHHRSFTYTRAITRVTP